VSALSRFLLAPRPAEMLATLRVVLCWYMATWRLPWAAFSALPADASKATPLMHAPLLELLGLPFPPTPGVSAALGPVLIGAAVLGGIGLLTRPALVVLGAGLLYVGAVGSSFGMFNHTTIMPVQIVFVLALVPGTTAWSVDNAIARWRRRREVDEPWLGSVRGPPAARWGALCVLSVVGGIYFVAGVAKVRYGGLAWLDGETLAFYLTGASFDPPQQFLADAAHASDFKDPYGLSVYLYRGRQTPVGAWLAATPPLPALLAVATLVLEVGAPFFLLSGPRGRALFAVSAVLFHGAIRAVMGPGFLPWQFIVAALAPWEPVGMWFFVRASRRWGRGAEPGPGPD
jgi:hypothetical protein